MMYYITFSYDGQTITSDYDNSLDWLQSLDELEQDVNVNVQFTYSDVSPSSTDGYADITSAMQSHDADVASRHHRDDW